MSEQANRVKEIRERANAAWHGEWRGTDGYSDQVFTYNADGSMERHVCDVRGWGHFTGQGAGALRMTVDEASNQMQADVAFIAHARQDIPYLLDLLDQLQRETEPVPLTEEQEIQNAFSAMVVAERSAQDHKWGYPQLNTLCEWASYLAEECGEAIKELNDLNFGKGDKEKLVTELVHTAAMCLAILQQYDTAVEVTKQKRDFVYAAREPKGEATT